jgi:lipoprotein NlpD
MIPPTARLNATILTLCAAALLGACSSTSNRAPVEDRGGPVRSPVSQAAPVESVAKVLPGAENAGKPGYYTVKPGDTLARIALENGQNWRDVARWSNLENPNAIEVGQVLRVVPPVSESAAAVARSVPPAGRVETRPLDAKTPAPAVSGAVAGAVPATAAASGSTAAPAAPAATAGTVPAAPAPAPPQGSPAAARDGDDEINWLWPASGTVVGGFDEARNTKGLAIAGKAGDPVLAAADGRVVYAGSGLRGYGNLVIVKHNNTYLTAYAHNQTLLVKEDQAVRRGQKIAEMGSTDAERVQLHFEIRRMGKPVDPARLLPPR